MSTALELGNEQARRRMQQLSESMVSSPRLPSPGGLIDNSQSFEARAIFQQAAQQHAIRPEFHGTTSPFLFASKPATNPVARSFTDEQKQRIVDSQLGRTMPAAHGDTGIALDSAYTYGADERVRAAGNEPASHEDGAHGFQAPMQSHLELGSRLSRPPTNGAVDYSHSAPQLIPAMLQQPQRPNLDQPPVHVTQSTEAVQIAQVAQPVQTAQYLPLLPQLNSLTSQFSSPMMNGTTPVPKFATPLPQYSSYLPTTPGLQLQLQQQQQQQQQQQRHIQAQTLQFHQNQFQLNLQSSMQNSMQLQGQSRQHAQQGLIPNHHPHQMQHQIQNQGQQHVPQISSVSAVAPWLGTQKPARQKTMGRPPKLLRDSALARGLNSMHSVPVGVPNILPVADTEKLKMMGVDYSRYPVPTDRQLAVFFAQLETKKKLERRTQPRPHELRLACSQPTPPDMAISHPTSDLKARGYPQLRVVRPERGLHGAAHVAASWPPQPLAAILPCSKHGSPFAPAAPAPAAAGTTDAVWSRSSAQPRISEIAKRLREAKRKMLQSIPQALLRDDPKAEERYYLEKIKLNLIPFQHQTRTSLLDSGQAARSLPQLPELSITPARYEREKKAYYYRQSEKILASDQKTRDRRRRDRHASYLNEVMTHRQHFIEFHKEKAKARASVARAVARDLQGKARREQKRQEENQRNLLRALKENDEEKYLQLLEETKNQRLLDVLHETESFLNKLHTKISATKSIADVGAERDRRSTKLSDAADSAAAAVSHTPDGTSGTDSVTGASTETIREAFLKSKNRYYAIAHTIVEEVLQQPAMLVGGTLKEYQLSGLQWLVSLYNNNLNGVLADEMGLGKTIQTIALLAYLMESKGNNGPHLVVVPLSTISNWSLEFQRWAPNIQVVVFKGSVSERKQAEAQIDGQKFNVLLSTYEYVMKEKKVLSKPHWSYIVVDEGHRMKNSKSKLATTFHKHYKSKHRVMLTGTPLQNNLTELWSLLNFLLPTIFDSSDNFEQWFNAPFSAGGEAIGPSQEETLLVIDRLHQVLRPFLLRRLKKEVEAQLPDKVELMIKCDMSEWQKLLYAQVRQKALVSIDSRTGSTKTKGLNNTLMHLRSVCNHPFLMYESYHSDEGRESELWRASGKFEVLHRMLPKLKATGHRVLLFSQFTSTLDVLEDYCDHVKLSHLRLDGQTSTDRRGELLQLFNADDSPYFIFLLSTRAGGLGLNLQTADTVIIFDSDWNPQADLQAQDRAHRIGQRNTVRIFRLITAGTVEESILARANEKLAMDAQIIQAGKFNLTSTHQERKTMLESILTKEVAPDKDEITDDSHMNSLIARDQEEFERFERMDEQQSCTLSLPRLMQYDELPQFIRDEVTKAAQPEVQDPKVYGRGAREKGAVNYSEGVSQAGAPFIEDDDETPEPKKRRLATDVKPADAPRASEPSPGQTRKLKRKIGADTTVVPEPRHDPPVLDCTPPSAKRLTRASMATDLPPSRECNPEPDASKRKPRKQLEAELDESDVASVAKRSRGRPKK